MPSLDKEQNRKRAREWYYKNKQRALHRIKKRYSENKNNPQFMQNRRQISRKSIVKHLEKHRQSGLDYYYKHKDKRQAYYQSNREKFVQRFRNRIIFLGKVIQLDSNPRRGVCSHCRHVGKTDIHHFKYDATDPLAYTIELCKSCHNKEPKGVILA